VSFKNEDCNLGGRFDPPHIGHYLIAKQVLELRPDIDKVLFVPASQHQWKPIIALPTDRIEMLKSFLEPKSKSRRLKSKEAELASSIDYC